MNDLELMQRINSIENAISEIISIPDMPFQKQNEICRLFQIADDALWQIRYMQSNYLDSQN